MSIAVFNSFSRSANDVATGTYGWSYITDEQSYEWPDWGGGVSTSYYYSETAAKGLVITNQTNRNYTLLESTPAVRWNFGGGGDIEEVIKIETDVINPHPTIKIEGANNTVTTITTLVSDWYRTPSTNIYTRTKNSPAEVWPSFTGEDFATWTNSSSPVNSGNYTDTTTARAVDADAGAAITVTLSNP